MLFLLFALTLIRNHTGLALPVSLEQSSPSSCSDTPQNSRTVWDIVWGCLVTIFACIWAALHSDVPQRLKDGTMEDITPFATPNFTRVPILIGVGVCILQPLVTLFAPEAIVTFAMFQLYEAQQIKLNQQGTYTLFVMHLYRLRNYLQTVDGRSLMAFSPP